MSKFIVGQNDLATARPEVAAEWHPTKNGDLTPNQTGFGSGKKVWWFGKCGHEWEAKVTHRTYYGVGCPYCSNRKVLSGFNDLATTHPELAAEWHPTKNGALTPEQVMPGSGKKVWWLGKCGHEWQSTVDARHSGRGCPTCGRLLQGANRTKSEVAVKGSLEENFPELAKEWHPTKNGSLSPGDITAGNSKKVWWLCRKGHEWQAVVSSRVKGAGCPHCSAELKTSFPEQAIFYYFSKITPAFNRYQYNGKTEIDVYFSEFMLGIEYDGPMHRSKAAQERDARKKTILQNAGITLIRVIEVEEPSDYNDSDTLIYCKASSTYLYLNEVMSKLIERLNAVSSHNFSVDVDIERDRSAIFDQYISMEKENSIAVKFPNLSAEWHPTKNGRLTPDMVSFGSTKKVWWRCENGHEWQARINSRAAGGNGCVYCSGQRVLTGINDLATLRPDVAAEWHPTKNGNLSPSQVTSKTSKKVWWKCANGHEWQAVIASRFHGQGCPFCHGRYAVVGETDFATTHPKLAAQWHPTKNSNLSPKDVKAGSEKKVWWICDKGHEWQTCVGNRSKGDGCPVCSGRIALAGFNDLTTLYPDIAVQWNYAKNGDLSPSSFRPGSNKKVWWCCEHGHEWQAPIVERVYGHGCPYCSNRKVSPGFNDLATTKPDFAAEWHPTKNGALLPTQITSGYSKKVWWRCKHGHEWYTSPNARTSCNSGCPICGIEKQKKSRQENKNYKEEVL